MIPSWPPWVSPFVLFLATHVLSEIFSGPKPHPGSASLQAGFILASFQVNTIHQITAC